MKNKKTDLELVSLVQEEATRNVAYKELEKRYILYLNKNAWRTYSIIKKFNTSVVSFEDILQNYKLEFFRFILYRIDISKIENKKDFNIVFYFSKSLKTICHHNFLHAMLEKRASNLKMQVPDCNMSFTYKYDLETSTLLEITLSKSNKEKASILIETYGKNKCKSKTSSKELSLNNREEAKKDLSKILVDFKHDYAYIF